MLPNGGGKLMLSNSAALCFLSLLSKLVSDVGRPGLAPKACGLGSADTEKTDCRCMQTLAPESKQSQRANDLAVLI